MLTPDQVLTDWRYRGQERHLAGKFWQWELYRGDGHDRCEFCQDQFATVDPEDHHRLDRGWCSSIGQRWVCADCMNDFGQFIDARLEGQIND